MAEPRYAELQVTSNFSFLCGASHPPELVLRSVELGLSAIALTDRNTLAGVVRAHTAAKELGLRFLVGARLDFTNATSLLAFPTNRAAYGRLTQLLTDGKRRAKKGECLLTLDDLFAYGDGQQFIALPPEQPDQAYADHLQALVKRFSGAVSLAAHHHCRGDDDRRILRLGELADRIGVPLVATNDVHYHIAERQPLQDVLTCVREGCTIETAGFRLHANAERHIKSPAEMARLFRLRPDAIARTIEIVEACSFSLDELKYEYPADALPEDRTPQEALTELVWQYTAERYPHGVSDKLRTLLHKELKLIEQRDYARYFLTIYDIVKYAREKNILCQGRGSAANSAVCFVLGITAVDPEQIDVLFERFISIERQEPPDIDVDFEHERREEVIQHIYEKYGRERAGIVASVITYRSKSAVRDVGKAMGLSEDVIGALASALWRRDTDGKVPAKFIREVGLDPADPTIRRTLALTKQLEGFPRHLSQHPGGFVLTGSPLSHVVPIENAAMPDRTFIEWDKDDLDKLQILKIDVLALGMLTCIHKGFDLLARHHGKTYEMHTIPQEEPAVYDMICAADTVGVFQIESRAQMTMLPRLKPRKFYDLVIEVAIVRPGPIQGDMVHPYLRRRNGKEDVDFPNDSLREVLGKTLGVPLFQEQAMRIAMVGAGFTSEEANQLRAAMATFRNKGTIARLERRFIAGMCEKGYTRDFAERCFNQIKGFGEYGFPESHAASFAKLVYVSAWLKHHHPAIFACAMLNSQPMGFYAPAQLVRDAREHGVEVRAVDVNHSLWDCTLETAENGGRALRLGFRQAKGFREADAIALVEARGARYETIQDVWRRSRLTRRALEVLANADAWNSIGISRRDALWQVKRLSGAPLPLFEHCDAAVGRFHNAGPVETAFEPTVLLPAMSPGEQVIEDYRHLTLSLKAHPVSFLRSRLAADGMILNKTLEKIADKTRVGVCGMVLIRQQPGTASGVIFMTIEDETGVANIVVWPSVFDRYRQIVLGSRLVGVFGRMQRDDSGQVIHVVAERMEDLTRHLDKLATPLGPETAALPDARHTRWDRGIGSSRDFH
jgi:error-prone DNA polymerase